MNNPMPHGPIKATPADLLQLSMLVEKVGWEEFMYHVGNLLDNEYKATDGPHKGALKAGRDVIWTFVNSFHYCDPANAAELCRQVREAAS
jgi:hypothetical protein